MRFVLAHDRRGSFRFAPLEGETARGILARHPALAGVDSLVLVEAGKGAGFEPVYVRSDAVLRIAEALAGKWRAARALEPVPRFLRDGVYRLLAASRRRLFGRLAACPAPDPAARARFLP